MNVPKTIRVSGFNSVAWYFLIRSMRAPAEISNGLNVRGIAFSAAAKLPERGAKIIFTLVNGSAEKSVALAKLVKNLCKNEI